MLGVLVFAGCREQGMGSHRAGRQLEAKRKKCR